MRQISLSISVALAITLVLVAGIPRTVRATSTCSDATLHGSYGVRATGNVLIAGIWVPLGIVGTFSYDGAGTVTVNVIQRVNGGNTNVNIAGTYSVNPDCTVSDTIGGSTHFAVVVDGGKGFFILNDTVGAPNIVSGEGRRVVGGGGDRN